MVQVMYTNPKREQVGRLFDSLGSIQDFVDSYLGSEEATLALFLSYWLERNNRLDDASIVEGKTLTVDWTNVLKLVDVSVI